MQTRLSRSDFRLVNADLAQETAKAAISWAVGEFGDGLCLLSSMQDSVLIDLALQVDPTIDVIFLDNGYQFPETLDTVERVEQHYRIRVQRITHPDAPSSNVTAGECCDRKPALLDRALAGRSAWLSGIRRDETANRATARLVEVDKRGLTKINPLVGWTSEDAEAYIDSRSVPANPLLSQGYSSVGCRPCTSPSDSGRDGRWAGLERTECGLHL